MLRDNILAVIRAFAGQARILTIPVIFIEYTGSLDCALFLAQLLFHSDQAIAGGHSEKGWFPRGYKEWSVEIHLGEYEIRKAINQLKSMGILETRVKKHNGAPTVWFRLKEADFSESILEFLQNRNLRNHRMDSVETQDSFLVEENMREIVSKDNGAIPPVSEKSYSDFNDLARKAQEAFDYWRERLNHPDAKFTDDRRRKVVARLREGYTLEQIKRGIDGCAASSFHRGENDTHTLFDDLELICRSGSKLEGFIARANGNGGSKKHGSIQAPGREDRTKTPASSDNFAFNPKRVIGG
ncbi:MAG: hypothetical protein AB1631_30655 [Acidobacteriota bacterium]